MTHLGQSATPVPASHESIAIGSLTLVLCHCIVISGGVLDVKKTCPVHGAREADRGG